MAERRNTLIVPHNSPGSLVFLVPVWWFTIGDFRQITGYISKSLTKSQLNLCSYRNSFSNCFLLNFDRFYCVNFSRLQDVVFVCLQSRTMNTITIDVMQRQQVYELLCILDFDNVRKRMSVSHATNIHTYIHIHILF